MQRSSAGQYTCTVQTVRCSAVDLWSSKGKLSEGIKGSDMEVKERKGREGREKKGNGMGGMGREARRRQKHDLVSNGVLIVQ